MNKPAMPPSARATRALWLVFKGAALNDDYPGKDFDAVPVACDDADLEASISSTLARETDDIELNVETAKRLADTLGRSQTPPQLVMGLRVYVAEATSLESLCLYASYTKQPRQLFEAKWPAQAGTPERVLAAGMAGLLRKQLHVLLREDCHLRHHESAGRTGTGHER